MSKTKSWAIAIMIVTTFCTSFAQVFLKQGASALATSFLPVSLLIGFGLYGLGAGLFFIALKGGEVSVLVPFFATSYLWVALLGQMFFGEVVNIFTWVGIGLVVFGIGLVGKGGNV